VGVLEMFAPGQVQAGDIAVLEGGTEPLAGLPFPAVATNVAYVDGVPGGNVFVMTLEGARRLAGAMMGVTEVEPSGATELTELELSAVSEAGNQMMATAAGAISSVLETEVEIGVPETRTFDSAGEAAGAYGSSPHVVRAAFSVCGEPCRLVQLVPNAFVVRMDRALDDLTSEHEPDRSSAAGAAGGADPGPPTPRWPASRSACGPSSAAPPCRRPTSSSCPAEPSSSSTSPPTTRSICTSTDAASRPAA